MQCLQFLVWGSVELNTARAQESGAEHRHHQHRGQKQRHCELFSQVFALSPVWCARLIVRWIAPLKVLTETILCNRQGYL